MSSKVRSLASVFWNERILRGNISLTADVHRSIRKMADGHLWDGFLSGEPSSRRDLLIRRGRFVQLRAQFVLDDFFNYSAFGHFLATADSMQWRYPGHVLRIDPSSCIGEKKKQVFIPMFSRREAKGFQGSPMKPDGQYATECIDLRAMQRPSIPDGETFSLRCLEIQFCFRVFTGSARLNPMLDVLKGDALN